MTKTATPLRPRRAAEVGHPRMTTWPRQGCRGTTTRCALRPLRMSDARTRARARARTQTLHYHPACPIISQVHHVQTRTTTTNSCIYTCTRARAAGPGEGNIERPTSRVETKACGGGRTQQEAAGGCPIEEGKGETAHAKERKEENVDAFTRCASPAGASNQGYQGSRPEW